MRAADLAPRYEPPPAWVKPAPPETKQAAPANAPIQLLLRDSQTRLGPEGDVAYVETRFKILTPEALSAGNLSLDWDPQTEILAIHHLTVVHDGKATDILADQKFTVIRREQGLEASMLDGRLTATLQIPGLQVGDIVDLATTYARRDPALAGHAQFLDNLPPAAIAGRIREQVSWPSGAGVTFASSPDLPKPVRGKAAGLEVATLEADGMPAATSADGAPRRFQVRRLFQASGFAGWRDISALMAPLYAGAATLKPDSPLKAEATNIRAATADPAERALLALQLVQNQIRYVYVGLDSGAYHPASADETWIRRFGDCKAKTALLLSLLSELGISAEPVLVNASGLDGDDGFLPQLSLFDHVLVRATIGAKTYWLDGTRLGDTALADLEDFPFGVGLPVRAAGEDLYQSVPPPLVRASSEVALEIDASAGLHARAAFTLRLVIRGDEAAQVDRELATASHDKAEQALKSAVTSDYPWFEPVSVTWRYDPRRRMFFEEVRGGGEVDWTKDDSGRPEIWYELNDSVFARPKPFKRDAAQDQTAPFTVTYPSFTRWVTTIRMPPSTAFGRQGEDVATTLGGVRYVRRTTTEGDTVVMYASIRSLKPEISAAEAAAAEAARPDFKPDSAWVWVADESLKPKPAKPAPDAEATAKAKSPTAAPTAEALLAEARRKDRLGQYTEALAEVEKALAAKPGWSDAMRERGGIYFRAGRYSEAADTFGEMLTAGGKPDEVLLRAQLTDLSLSHRYAEAQKVGDAALAAFPKSVKVRKDRASDFARQKQHAKALAELDAALALAPGDFTAIVAKAQELWDLNRRDESLQVLEAAIRNDPDEPDLLSGRAFMEMHIKHFQAAVDDIDDAQRMDPAAQAYVFRRAEIDERQGHFDAAIQTLDAAVVRWPKSVGLLNSRCWNRALWGVKLDLAAKDCDAAVALSPRYLAAMDSRAFVSFRQNDFADAVSRYDAILAIRPDYAASLYGRGLTKLKSGDKAGGDRDIAAALKSDSSVADGYNDYGFKP
ncbi:MAG TPA: DUF3857 domain-containing protein [Phenylobacterium sp.]|nr:DUF3857 domain-containing protein [Phenylobacterium sp.]